MLMLPWDAMLSQKFIWPVSWMCSAFVFWENECNRMEIYMPTSTLNYTIIKYMIN